MTVGEIRDLIKDIHDDVPVKITMRAWGDLTGTDKVIVVPELNKDKTRIYALVFASEDAFKLKVL